MKVLSDTQAKIELVSRHIEGEMNRYTARLFTDFVEHTTEEMGEEKARTYYECEMYVTDVELSFATDEEAVAYYTNNFDVELERAKKEEGIKAQKDAQIKNRTALEYFDYVGHKTWEMVLRGSTIEEVREWLKKDKGINFLDEREAQREGL